MNNIEKIIEITKNAIKESGKPFNQIPENSILKFLESNGVAKSSTRKEVYKQLQLLYSNENNKSQVAEVKEVKEVVKPAKEGRKSVFGEIKRIA